MASPVSDDQVQPRIEKLEREARRLCRRRALRNAGQDPAEAQVRDAATVERCLV